MLPCLIAEHRVGCGLEQAVPGALSGNYIRTGTRYRVPGTVPGILFKENNNSPHPPLAVVLCPHLLYAHPFHYNDCCPYCPCLISVIASFA